MTKKLPVLVFLFCFMFSFSQESKVIDSLKREIVIAKNDTIKAILLNKISGIFWNSNPDSTNFYAEKSLKISKSKKFTKGVILAYTSLGVGFEIKGEFKKAAQYYAKALADSKKINDREIEANIHYNLGNLFTQLGDKKKALNYFKNSIKLYELKDRKKIIAKIKLNIALIYSESNYFQSAIKTINEAIFDLKKINDKFNLAVCYDRIGVIYFSIKEYKKSIENYKTSILYSNESKNHTQLAYTYVNIAGAYGEIKDYHKTKYFLNKALVFFKQNGYEDGINTVNLNLCELAVKQKKYNEALEISNSLLSVNSDFPETQIFIYRMSSLSHFGLQEFKKSSYYSKKAYLLAKKINKNDEMIINSQLYLKSYLKEKNEKLGYECLNVIDSLTNIKNAIENKKNFIELDTKYRTAEKEAKIKEQQLQLEKEKTNRNMAFAGIGTLILLSGAGFWLYRNKQNQKQLQSQNTLLGLQQNLNAMQLDNLNKQLDPHEIKNILANISPEIQRNAPDAYNKMTKLLNLTRASLSSNSITDSIENQLQQIEDYLSLEKTVLPVPLSYTIKNELKTNKQIPRLLLKNLVENAVKHGIKNKKGGGEINVSITEKNHFIHIAVDDSGIGRQQAISLDSGIGTSTYINLFETLNKVNTEKANFNIIDKEQGTTVEIVIPNNYFYS